MDQPHLNVPCPHFILKNNGLEVHAGAQHLTLDATQCHLVPDASLILVVAPAAIEVYSYALKKRYEIPVQDVMKVHVQGRVVHVLKTPPSVCTLVDNKPVITKYPSHYFILSLAKDRFRLLFSRELRTAPHWPYATVKHTTIAYFTNRVLEYYAFPEQPAEELLVPYNEARADADELPNVAFVEFSPFSAALILAAFVPQMNRFPALVNLYQKTLGAPLELVNTISFFNAERCELLWCPTNRFVLALSSIDHDDSHQSYYGISNLHALYVPDGPPPALPPSLFRSPAHNIFTETLCKIEIQHVAFDPTGRLLAVLYDRQPAKLIVFETARMEKVFEKNDVYMNTLLFSPNAQFLAVGGFGNLPGDIEVYETGTFTRITVFSANCTTAWRWTPDNTRIVCGQCYPRRQVDCQLQVFTKEGQLESRLDVVVREFELFGTPVTKAIPFRVMEVADHTELWSASGN